MGQGKLLTLITGQEALPCPAGPQMQPSTSAVGISHQMDGVQVGFVLGGPGGGVQRTLKIGTGLGSSGILHLMGIRGSPGCLQVEREFDFFFPLN